MGFLSSLFGDWGLEKGDEVVDKEGRVGKVRGHKPDGFVDVAYDDGKGGKVIGGRFGGSLTKVDSGKKK